MAAYYTRFNSRNKFSKGNLLGSFEIKITRLNFVYFNFVKLYIMLFDVYFKLLKIQYLAY